MNKQMLINLKKALNSGEQSLNLTALSLLEKEVYYGILDIADDQNEFSSAFLRDTISVLDIPHATYHRMIKNLLEKGFIVKAPNRKRNAYVLLK